ncbi:MAG: N-acetylglucosamine-6-phosphate deacetylase [Lachnospiraceae bacterium]|nr:N-acetylglucosamine-6-phosphate deacetylase [Lachnospiraceae bacterium]
MIVKNIRIFRENGAFEEGELYTDGSQLSQTSGDHEILDGQGAYAIPGLTDIHFHGCVGYDFCDGTWEAFEAIAAYELQNGVTQICPATMTLPEETLTSIGREALEFARWQDEEADQEGSRQTTKPPLARLCGIHMEGPFLSLEKKGAQNPLYLKKPDLAMYRRLQKAAGGLYRLVSLAPELEGAMEFIEALKGQVVLSIAHTTADYDTAWAALAAGASHATHLYNAMMPFSHRAPGVVGAAFDDAACQVELICDGIHIAPAMVRATFKMFGDDRVILISDSMMATGLTDGDYSLGGQAVKVTGSLATLADGTIAGSATNLMDCMRHAVKDMGIPLWTAVKCATVNPAKSIGIYDRFGSLDPGKTANVVLLNENLDITGMLFQGKVVK